MASLYMACRLPLSLLMIVLLLCVTFLRSVSLLHVYDRKALLNIGVMVENSHLHDINGQSKTPPPLLAYIPPYLQRPLVTLPHNTRWHRCRRCGKRGRRLVKLWAHLALVQVMPNIILFRIPRQFNHYNVWHPVEFCYSWLQPVNPEACSTLPHHRHTKICRWGRTQGNIHLLGLATQKADLGSIRMALFNTRSLTNKTFMYLNKTFLNDFFHSHLLDFFPFDENADETRWQHHFLWVPPTWMLLLQLPTAYKSWWRYCYCLQRLF